MKRFVITVILGVLMSSSCYAADRSIGMSTNPGQALLGEEVNFQCTGEGDWKRRLRSAKIEVRNLDGDPVVSLADMKIDGLTANYNYVVPVNEQAGNWSFTCEFKQRKYEATQTASFTVAGSGTGNSNTPPVAGDDSVTTPYEKQVTIDVLANDTDAENNLDPASLVITAEPSNGLAELDGGGTVLYDPQKGFFGIDSFDYQVCDTTGLCVSAIVSVTVAESQTTDEPPIVYLPGSNNQHNNITQYTGPETCLQCHKSEAAEMLTTLHMKWSGKTDQLTDINGTLLNGEELGKGNKGINTFCTYAPSSRGACYSCHVRADGNAPDEPKAADVDCLMCHSDSYQRTFVVDPDNTESIVFPPHDPDDPNQIRPPQEALDGPDSNEKTYKFGLVDADGNYTSLPDYSKMTINVVDAARTVHMPTNTSCLRCHAKAGGGDWTKRGDMGLNSASATVAQDVHLAKEQDGGAELSCVDCHSALNHQISGRGIDLRQTEADAPTCQACHDEPPHSNSTLNRHAQGQVSCQVCHIREYAKGGATEMSRDWSSPVWNSAFCSGQGGFVGHEVKESFVQPEYVWFDGTSYVYNVGETIEPDERGVYPMAKANGGPFDGKSFIVPIKRHFSIMPLHDESSRIIPPAIMWMFMTGDFDVAVQKGVEEQAEKGVDYSGSYSLVEADTEMLITHGVEPKEKAPSCNECHDNSGSTADGTGMIPFEALGYHQVPEAVRSCSLCHERKSMQWESMHNSHRDDDVSCSSCHTPEPAGVRQGVCNDCHENKSWRSDEGHKKHFIEKNVDCIRCHTFS